MLNLTPQSRHHHMNPLTAVLEYKGMKSVVKAGNKTNYICRSKSEEEMKGCNLAFHIICELSYTLFVAHYHKVYIPLSVITNRDSNLLTYPVSLLSQRV